jgi:hypothetical protein
MHLTYSPLVHATLQGDLQVYMQICWQATCCMAQGLEPGHYPMLQWHAKSCITLSRPTLVSCPYCTAHHLHGHFHPLTPTLSRSPTHAPCNGPFKPLHTPFQLNAVLVPVLSHAVPIIFATFGAKHYTQCHSEQTCHDQPCINVNITSTVPSNHFSNHT